MFIVGVAWFLIILGAIVFVHEFGHFIVAKMSGMKVPNFSMGFGPALIKWERNGTEYAIRLIPLGGYVLIAGMEPSEGDDTEEGKGLISDYNNKPWFSKFAVIVAGAMMNFIFALVVFVIMGMAIGYLQPGKDPYIIEVNKDTPAMKAGLQRNDRIVQINELEKPTLIQLQEAIKNSTGEIKIVVNRQGTHMTLAVTPTDFQYYSRGNSLIYTKKTMKGIGVVLDETSGVRKRLNYSDSVLAGVNGVARGMIESVASILSLVTGNISPKELSGPVGIARITYGETKDAASSIDSLFGALSLMGFLSVAIGFTNLLPLPALDGGRLVFIVIEGIRRKPIDRNKEGMVHMVGLAILLGLIVLISIKDAWMWIGGK
ncbi:MAG: M50 family metallopeptidase [bacterium]